MKYSIKDTLLTWNNYPSYMFLTDIVGPNNTAIFKFSNCYSIVTKKVFESRFWIIYSVTGQGLTKSAGYIFEALGEVFISTTKAVSSCLKGNTKDVIACLEKTKEWSADGLDLIRYSNAGEVITDLCTVMGVDVTVELEG